MHNKGHGAPEVHVHDTENPKRYSFDVAVKTSGKNIRRKAKRKAINQAFEIAQQGWSNEAFSEGASGTRLKIGKQPGNSRNIISLKSNKAGVTPTYGADGAVYDEANKNVTKKDIKKAFNENGSVTVSGGKATPGTTATKKKYGDVERDNKKIERDNKKIRIDAEISRAKLEKSQAREAKSKALQEKKSSEAAAKAEKIANYKKTELAKQESRAAKAARLKAAKAARLKALILKRKKSKKS